MNLQDYTRLLRIRWRLLVSCVLIGALTATAVSLTTEETYTARTQLFVSATDSIDADDIGQALTGGQFTLQRVKSYAAIIGTPEVSRLVIEDLGLDYKPSALAKRVKATSPVETVLINVSVSDSSPERAQAIAASLGEQFAMFVQKLETPAGGGAAPIKVSVVQPPQLPLLPTAPRPRRNLALGLLAGLLVGASAAVLRETLDTTIKSPAVATDLVHAPMLGAITYDSEASKRPLIVHVAPNSTRAEAFRQLRTNLQFVDIEHELRSVVVTSSIPGEGKSTTTCNLAISLAQAGVRVVLVEGDLRRPRVADYMGIEGAVGLTSVLLGRVPLVDALQPWGDGVLQILASGPLPPNPSELLGSTGMEELLRQLEGMVDVVLIDAPPLLPVTDAAVLGSMTSGVIMLVRSNHTRREQLKRATETVRAVGAPVLGTVLNMVPAKGPDAYAYGYGYGYGGYYTQGKTGRLDRSEVSVGSETSPDALRGSSWSRLHGRAGSTSAQSTPESPQHPRTPEGPATPQDAQEPATPE